VEAVIWASRSILGEMVWLPLDGILLLLELQEELFRVVFDFVQLPILLGPGYVVNKFWVDEWPAVQKNKSRE
jgi:hypothetical protein